MTYVTHDILDRIRSSLIMYPFIKNAGFYLIFQRQIFLVHGCIMQKQLFVLLG